MNITIDLGQAIYALSDALDLVGVDEVGHGKRVGYMALCCGQGLGLDEELLEDLFYTGLLHDCGVSSTQVHRHLVNDLDWEHAEDHCIRGSNLLSQFPPLAHLAPTVRWHHAHWDTLCTLGLPEQTAKLANLIYLVDRADALAAPHYEHDVLLARQTIRHTIQQLSGTFFAPELVTLFLDLSSNEAFWLSLEPRHLMRIIYGRQRKLKPALVSFAELRQLALLFARIVDAKSPFTMQHSLGTARLARFLAKQVGLAAETCKKIEIAALLHDLGKLQVPDEILEKPGSLTEEERTIIQRHSFETYQILGSISGLEDISLWAACHHETPDGQGYPFHLRGVDLTVEMRIIAVSDVFQALAQQRPYRKPQAPERILDLLRDFARHDHLDRQIVELVGQHLPASWQAATVLSPFEEPFHLAALPAAIAQ